MAAAVPVVVPAAVAQVPAAQVLRAAVREREQPPVRVLPRPQPVVSQSA